VLDYCHHITINSIKQYLETKSHRATTQVEFSASEEIMITEDVLTKITRSRRALGDVSNKNSQDGANDDKHTATGDTKNRALRRSRRLSNVSRNDDRNPSSYHEITAAVAARNLVSKKRGRNDKTQEMPIVNPLETKRQSPSQRQEAKEHPKVEHDNFDIEAMLLEPKPKLKRKRAKSTSTRGRKKNRKNEGLKRSVDPKTSKEVMASFQSNSTILFNPKNLCSDLLVTSEDDYCLLRKVEGPFDASKFTTGIATYDKVHQEDMDQVPAYVTDIFQRLFDAEENSRPSPSYMTNEQNDINSTMRAILIDWLAVVHTKFRLLPETLYLCVNIIDRYLSRTCIHRRSLQLLGITSLFVACKYEEIYPPEVKDCVYITDRTYSRQDILDMEFKIVKVLEFKMTVPTAYPFLQRFLHITNAPKIVRDLASFYTERMLQEYCMLNFRGSLLACAAVCLAWNNPTALEYFEVKETYISFPRLLEKITIYAGFFEEEIKHAASVLSIKMQHNIKHLGSPNEQFGSPNKQLTGVSTKYRSDRYSNASSCDLPQISHLNLP